MEPPELPRDLKEAEGSADQSEIDREERGVPSEPGEEARCPCSRSRGAKSKEKKRWKPTGSSDPSAIPLPKIPAEVATRAAQAIREEASGVAEVVHEWASVASIHGVPYMLDKNVKTWRKATWTLLLLAASIVMFLFIHLLIQEFFEFPVNTRTLVESPTELDFPEVVFCRLINQNATKINETGILNPKNREELMTISYGLESTFDYASFQGEDLRPLESYFAPFITERGLCYRFKSRGRIITESGVLPGIGGYDKASTAGLSVVVLLHGPSDAMLVYVSSENLTEITQSPVQIVSNRKLKLIGLSRTRIERVTEKPWSVCNASAPPGYTREICRANCWRMATRAIRNCTTYGDTSDEATTMDYCPFLKQGPVNDASDAPWRLMARQCIKESCLDPPCQEDLFSMKASTLELSEDMETTGNYYSYISINYERMRVESISESIGISLITLLASVGGAMGLFLGISTLSLIELVGELFIIRLFPRMWGDKRLYGLGSKEL